MNKHLEGVSTIKAINSLIGARVVRKEDGSIGTIENILSTVVDHVTGDTATRVYIVLDDLGDGFKLWPVSSLMKDFWSEYRLATDAEHTESWLYSVSSRWEDGHWEAVCYKHLNGEV
jgi:hypothetical protein